MISIIIPCFNMAQYLPDCIESVLENHPYEVIFVDDGSDDNSLEVARTYPIKIIHQVNKGLASARNTGIMNATGDYCLFLDADDLLAPNAIERIEQEIEETNADVIAPSFKEFGLSNHSVILMEHPTVEDFKEGNRIGYCSAIKRSALLAIGGYSPKMTWGAEDYHLWFNLLTRGYTIKTIPDILWLYRVKEQSMWTETQKHQEAFMAQIKKDFPLWT